MPKLIKAIDDAVLVRPGAGSALASRSTVADELFPDRDAAEEATKENAKAIDGL